MLQAIIVIIGGRGVPHGYVQMGKNDQNPTIGYSLLIKRGFKGCQSLFFSIELKKLSLEQCYRPLNFKYGVEWSPMGMHKWAKITKILKKDEDNRVVFAHLCTHMGDPWAQYLTFYGLENCSKDSFLSSMLKKSDWHPLKPLSTNNQQGVANFRIFVIFAHLCIAMGDPSTPYFNFYGLKHCFGASFLRFMLEKSD